MIHAPIIGDLINLKKNNLIMICFLKYKLLNNDNFDINLFEVTVNHIGQPATINASIKMADEKLSSTIIYY